MASIVGRTLGGFLIKEELGRGAMGVVFKARQLSMERDVALKFLPQRLAQDKNVVARFLREARSAGQLSHPNIVEVHDVGMMEGLHYISMEFVDGNSVQKQISTKGPFDEKETLGIAAQIADALRYAHTRGILHRDIKPDNFLIDTAGRVRLADLGLARLISEGDGESSRLTQDGSSMGTPHYMSPEQCKGAGVDGRSDLYSLGASMYVMATGKTPYEAGTSAAVMVKVLTEAPRALKEIAPHLSEGFIRIVEKLMSKDPSQRFANAHGLLDAIERWKNGDFRSTLKASIPVNKWVQTYLRRPLVMGGMLGLIALAILGLIFRPATPASRVLLETARPIPEGRGDGVAPAMTQRPAQLPPADAHYLAVPIPKSLVVADDTQKNLEMNEIEALKREMIDQYNLNPSAFNLKTFLIRNPRMLRLGMEQLKQTLAAEAFTRNWQTKKELSASEFSLGNKQKALRILCDFIGVHDGSDEAGEARQKLAEILTELRQASKVAADAAHYESAQRMLEKAIECVPPDMSESLKSDLDEVCKRRQQRIDSANAEIKILKDLYKKTSELTFRRYCFSEASKECLNQLENIHSQEIKLEVKSLSDVYLRAVSIIDQLRLSVNKDGIEVELPKLGKVKIFRWNDHDLSILPLGYDKNASIMLPYEKLLSDDLVRMTNVIQPNNEQVGYLCDRLAFTFAAGAEDEALKTLEKLNKVEINEPHLRKLVETVLRWMKPDIRAQKLFNEALVAREKNDWRLVQQMQQALVMEFADTNFVKGHLKEIDGLPPPFSDSSGFDVLPPSQDKKNLQQESEVDADSSTTMELKNLGWTHAFGNWNQDKQQSTYFCEKNRGRLICEKNDGKVHVNFKLLDENANVGIFAHYIPRHKRAPDPRETGLEIARGFGIQVLHGKAYIYFGNATQDKGLKKWPSPIMVLKSGEQPLPLNTVHNLTLSVRGDNLDLTLNGRAWHASADAKFINEGVITIIIEGKVELSGPPRIEK